MPKAVPNVFSQSKASARHKSFHKNLSRLDLNLMPFAIPSNLISPNEYGTEANLCKFYC